MAPIDPVQLLRNGAAPKTARMLAARGLVPFPPNQMLEILVSLRRDGDPDVAAQANQTLETWSEEELVSQLRDPRCSPAVLNHFVTEHNSAPVLRAAVTNPAIPGSLIESIALTVPAPVLETILENRARILEFPGILQNVKLNPSISPDAQRIVREIETEFFGGKKIEYTVEKTGATGKEQSADGLPEFDFLPEDLSLEDIPVDPEAREAVVQTRVATLPLRDKLRYALYGTREIRTMLVRDSNREVAKMVLRSPKLTGSEVETIAAMRGISEELLREIGTSNHWTKSYSVVQNLVKNPKTPPAVSQRLLFRLHSNDLTLLTRDRSVADAVRHNAARTLKQRASATATR